MLLTSSSLLLPRCPGKKLPDAYKYAILNIFLIKNNEKTWSCRTSSGGLMESVEWQSRAGVSAPGKICKQDQYFSNIEWSIPEKPMAFCWHFLFASFSILPLQSFLSVHPSSLHVLPSFLDRSSRLSQLRSAEFRDYKTRTLIWFEHLHLHSHDRRRLPIAHDEERTKRSA